MKIKREAHKKAQEEEAEAIEAEASKVVLESPPKEKPAKQPTRKKLPDPEYITKRHLETFKQELLSSIPSPGERIVEKEVERFVEKPVEKIVERPVEKIVEREKIVTLSGNALLDRIFFNR